MDAERSLGRTGLCPQSERMAPGLASSRGHKARKQKLGKLRGESQFGGLFAPGGVGKLAHLTTCQCPVPQRALSCTLDGSAVARRAPPAGRWWGRHFALGSSVPEPPIELTRAAESESGSSCRWDEWRLGAPRRVSRSRNTWPAVPPSPSGRMSTPSHGNRYGIRPPDPLHAPGTRA